MSEQQQSLFGPLDDESEVPVVAPGSPELTSSAGHPQPADQDQRNQITFTLDDTLFVEAGAGSGKTTSLVSRVVSLVREGTPIDGIAAITFTEKAASELRDRIREVLDQRVASPEATDSPLHVDRFEAALDALDGAAISTLHAFAQRILSEHPVEAQLPPAVEVQDEISSQVAFEDRWQRFIDDLLEDPESGRDFLIANAGGVSIAHLQALARRFNNNWDLIGERQASLGGDRIELDLGYLVDQVAALADLGDECVDPDDKLAAHLPGFGTYADQLRGSYDDIELLERLVNPTNSFAVKNKGKKDNWPNAGFEVGDVRGEVATVFEAITEARNSVAHQSLGRLGALVAQWTLDAAEERRVEGRLEYHDLLVRARQLLRTSDTGAETRATLRERYPRLLLDEFQDTDPIQIELACLIASTDQDGSKPWHELNIPAGSLFFVGDPKQSIYRFRRADINLFLQASRTFADEPVQLTTNFRTTSPIIRWINHVFGRLIKPEPGSQPDYQPLEPVRSPAPGGHSVVVLGVEHPDTFNAADLREAEAADVANTICLALQEEWQVRDDSASENDWRPAELGDITILLPARTSLTALERELDRAEVPYRAESSSLVYSTSEVRDLLAVLRSVADPTDELALSTALRSTLFGCGDDDLYTFHQTYQGRWNHQLDLPAEIPADHPVAEAMVFLRQLHDSQMWLAPSELIERIVRERRLLELGFTERRPRDLWRRIRFLVDQARAYAESEGGGLREYLAWAELQSAEGARVSEAVLPETDDDSVRIMTIHGSKGLEFPITIMSGLTTKAQRKSGGVQVLFPDDGTVKMRIKKDLESFDFERYAALDEQLSFHETLRLLYVGATRACDHLVVSVHRKARKTAAQLTTSTMAELLCGTLDDAPPFEHIDPENGAVEPPSLRSADPLVSREDWEAELGTALDQGSRRRVLAATTIARLAADATTGDPAFDGLGDDPARDPGLQKQSRNLDLPPWQKGRYGTAIGRAVHGTLQTADLTSGDGLDQVAAAQAAAEGVLGKESIVEALSRSALRTDVVTEAIRGDYWREMYVAAPLSDDLVLEGYIDLLYRTADGLVVVDYKTDAVPDAASLAAKLGRYRLQGATYALAVEEATGEAVSRVVFAFLREDGAAEHDVADLRGAIDEVRATAALSAARASDIVDPTTE